MAGGIVVVVIFVLQSAYLRDLEPIHRPRSTLIAWFNRLAVILNAVAGLTIVWRNDMIGFYLLLLGVLFCFLGVGANAWVLLIEIKR
jgi:hypothetical protein